MAQVLGEGTGADVARIWLLVGNEFRPAAAWPVDTPARDASQGPDRADSEVPVRS